MNASLPLPAHRRAPRGFTLVELMTTLAVAGVLIVGAMPSLSGIILSQGVKSTSVDLVGALTLTRSEAIKRNRRITLRPESNDWRRPWFLCSAPDASAPSLVRGRCPSGEVELNLREWTLPQGVSVEAVTTVTTTVRTTSPAGTTGTTTTTTTTPVSAVSFRADGRTTAWVQFTLCTATANAAVTQRIIRLDAGGRPSLRRGGPCGS